MNLSKSYARLLACVILAAVLASPAAGQQVEIVPDVVYGHKDGMALTFDVIRPLSGATGAGVLYMVSGGWVSSYAPPQQTALRFQGLLDQGITVFVVRHGSSPKYLVPEIVEDVRRASRYIRYNASRWGVDPERLGAFGGSAGGHLALMLGLPDGKGDPTASEPFLRETSKVASVVAYYPPVDLRQLARGVNAVNAASTPAETQRFPALNFERERGGDYSPLLFVSPDDPPTLLIHGDADELVPVSNSHILNSAFQEHGVRNELIIIPGAGHGYRGEDAVRASEAMTDWFVRTLAAER